MLVVVSALLMAAPALAFCPCERPAPKEACGDCCGDTRPEQCPRAEKCVDSAESADKSTEPGPIVIAVLPVLSTVELTAPRLPTPPDGLPPPSRPRHLVLTALLL